MVPEIGARVIRMLSVHSSCSALPPLIYASSLKAFPIICQKNGPLHQFCCEMSALLANYALQHHIDILAGQKPS
eukprot:scaffold65624_cov20-Prasinocladus_malaysianus.AAC.1